VHGLVTGVPVDSTYPMNTEHSMMGTSGFQSQQQQSRSSEGFFGWLPGSGIMHRVIEKTKVRSSHFAGGGVFSESLLQIFRRVCK